MESFDGHARQIIKANDDNKLAIFVGAGVSMSSNTSAMKLPSWWDLIKELQADLKISDESDYLKVAQLYFLEFGEVAYYNKIKEFFPDNIEPSYIHDLLLDIDPQCIITTNWDSLFEKTIDKKITLHEVICSDKDLVKSKSTKNIIKMHGDFKNHNIVFKEDDYLNYTHNFPLLENYVKSILSTHTVLFLGYSYNDINLKHIMKWIQNHSSYTPPMYLVAFQENSSQKQYLENHGIKTLVINENNHTKTTNAFKGSDWRSSILASFLENIKYKNADRDALNQDVDPLNFIYQKLKHLESLDYVLLEQIRVSLGNCGYKYDSESQPILNFYSPKGVLTKDYSENLRILYQSFKAVLVSGIEDEKELLRENATLHKIFVILAKANIAGVITEEDERGKATYFINSLLPLPDIRQEQHRGFLTEFSKEGVANNNRIDDISSNAYKLFKEKDYEGAFRKNTDIILLCNKQKNYSQLLIALFNKNILVWHLKHSLLSKNTEKFSKLDEVDIQGQFFSLPKSELKKLQPLYDFVSLKRIYEVAYNSSNELNKINQAAKSIKNGGIHFNNYADKPSAEHVDLLLFTTINKLMVNHEVYSSTIQNFVKISIARQSIQNNIKLNLYELFSCINFFSNKELTIELEMLLVKNKSKKLLINQADKTWLTSVFLCNTIDTFIGESSVFKKPESELQNIITLLSVIELDDESITLIMGEFERLTLSNQNSINTYESINNFLAHQHNIFQKSIENEILIKIIDNLISKVVYKKANGWDVHALTSGSLFNLYGLVGVNKGIYSNVKLIRKLLAELSELNVQEKIKYTQTLLFSIFNIGNKAIQKIISDFVLKIHQNMELCKDNEFHFYFWSLASGFISDLELSVVDKIKGYLVGFEDGKVFHGRFYDLKSIIDYLVTEKSTHGLEEVQSILNNIIALHDSRSNPSNL